MLVTAVHGDETEELPISSLTGQIQIESAGQAAATLTAAACGAVSSVGLCSVFSPLLSLKKDPLPAGLVLHRQTPLYLSASPPAAAAGSLWRGAK